YLSSASDSRSAPGVVFFELCGGLAIPEVFGGTERLRVGSSDPKNPIALLHKAQEQQNRRHVDEIGSFVPFFSILLDTAPGQS
ncbi:MAG TPA: hypothetical protein VMC85_14615, partial [Desulfomonilaceae bacterium]|nr:hypothetical protein [Desulfomonilaceae bacterium]